MKFNELVDRLYTEAHITDVMPKTFFEFVKKYKKVKADPYLFVQFSNYAGSTVELGAYGNPDHRDPVGVYGYPLKYVIDYPADIRYGSNAKYLRVLRNTSPMDTLVLSDLPEWRAEGYMYKMGLEPSFLRQIGRHVNIPRNSSMHGKRLFGCIQYDFANGKPVLRSGAEQTKLLRKICKAVEDRAKTRNTAIINSSEPQQIIFLSRDSFKVEEVFQLRQEADVNLMSKKDSDVVLAQRIANLVFKNMDDSIKEQTVSKKEKHTYLKNCVFFSKKGLQLSIDFDNQIPTGWTFGKPTTKFKDFKTNTRSFPTLEIKGPRGELKRKYSIASKSEEIAHDFARAYMYQEEDPIFQPITKNSYEEEKQRAEEERKNKIAEERKAERIKEETEFRKDYLLPIMNKFDIQVPVLPMDKVLYVDVLLFILRYLDKHISENHPEKNTTLPEDLEYIWSNATGVSLVIENKRGKEVLENVKEIFNKIALGNYVERNIYPWIRELLDKD